MPSQDPIVLPSVATDEDLDSAPIDPSWILEGTPQARARRLTLVDDSGLSATLWQSNAGRFEWHYGSDELVNILGGEVEITPPSGQPFTARQGDVFFVPGGSVLHWHVRDHVKKLVVNPVQTPLIRKLAARIPFARRVVRRMRGVRGHP
jgi:uncharacterized cupin superfamily protein